MCTEAGMSAIRAERDYVIHEDFMKVTMIINFFSVVYHVILVAYSPIIFHTLEIANMG